MIADTPGGREPVRDQFVAQHAKIGAPFENAAGNDNETNTYWRRRERTARALAARAIDQHIARIHLDMAERYAALAKHADASIPTK